MQLALGAAQFGLDYGITNSGGKVSLSEVKRILEVAQSNRMQVIDTANQYGNSEEILGEALTSKNSFAVVTKSPLFSSDKSQWEQELTTAFERSLTKLKHERLYGYLFHNGVGISEETYSYLKQKQASGLVQKVGISAYSPEEVIAINKNYPVDLVQLPLNLWDQRVLRGGFLKYCREQEIEIHVRSLFLQGLLLESPSDYPKFIRDRVLQYSSISQTCELEGVRLEAACLSLLKTYPEISCGVIGVTSAKELKANIEAYNSRFDIDCAQFSIDDEIILNPARWPKEERE